MNPLKRLQNQADKLLQEKGRKKYKLCEICSSPMSCMHHFFPKSISSALRYDWDNLVPICVSHHFSHHNGDPRIHAYIIKKRGEKWYKELLRDKEKIIKVSQSYYKMIINKLK